MAAERSQAATLARRLRELRQSVKGLTQAEFAHALSAEGSVAPATVSSWESPSIPKTPSEARLEAYARFFCTPRSLEGGPHLLAETALSGEERRRYRELELELLELSSPEEHGVQHSFRFETGPVVVVCSAVPEAEQGSLADSEDPNFTKLRQYGDLDALIEIYGHLRAENPALDVFHRTANEVRSDDLSSHLVLLGGIAWNRVTRRIQSALSRIPIQQIAVPDLRTGRSSVSALARPPSSTGPFTKTSKTARESRSPTSVTSSDAKVPTRPIVP